MATNGPIDEFDNLFPTPYPLSAIEGLFNGNTPGDSDLANVCTSAFSDYPENIVSFELFDIPSQYAPHSSPIKTIPLPTAEPADIHAPSAPNEYTPSIQTSDTTRASILGTLNQGKMESLVQQIQESTKALRDYQAKCDSEPLVAPSELGLREQRIWVNKIKRKRSAALSRYNRRIRELEDQLQIEDLRIENLALKKAVMPALPLSGTCEANQLTFEYLQAENLRLESVCKSLVESNSALSQTATALEAACESLRSRSHHFKAENDELKRQFKVQSEFFKAREELASQQLSLFMQQYQILANAHSHLQSQHQQLRTDFSARVERTNQMTLSFENFVGALIATQERTRQTVKSYKEAAVKSELEKKARDVQFTDMQEQIQTLTRALETRNQRQACDDEIRIPAIEHARKREQTTGWTPLSSYRTPQNTDETRLPHPRQQCGNFP